jgi:hypothetical protein
MPRDPPDDKDSKGQPWDETTKQEKKPANPVHMMLGALVFAGMVGAFFYVTFDDMNKQEELKQLELQESFSLDFCMEKARTYLLKSLEESTPGTSAAFKAQAWLTAIAAGVCK